MLKVFNKDLNFNVSSWMSKIETHSRIFFLNFTTTKFFIYKNVKFGVYNLSKFIHPK